MLACCGPITLYPFPTLNFQRLVPHARVFVVVEMSNGQMIEDVRLALNGARPVELLNRMGGNVPSHEEVLEFVRGLARHGGQCGTMAASGRKRSRWPMSSELISEYEVVHAKPKAFYESYERKDELQHQTHYCPGCGHGTIHKMLARAIDELGIQDRTILISPVGCSVFAYYYFDVGNVQAAHGRAPAVATGLKRSRPGSIVIGYQGDGDLSAIGSAEILHAANRGENITVIFVNNAIYSMTGGQIAPTTLLGQKSTTTPNGRNALNEGYPLHVSELLATLEAPVYIERVGLGDNKQIAQATRAIRRGGGEPGARAGLLADRGAVALPDDLEDDAGGGAALGARCDGEDVSAGGFRDRTKEAQREAIAGGGAGAREHSADSWRRRKKILREGELQTVPASVDIDLHVRVAGFGGQGVLLLGEVLAEAGLDAGLEVSWLPSYGPEMRSGTSNCHVRLVAGADRFAAGDGAQCSGGDERAFAAEVRPERAPGRMGDLQRRDVSRRMRARRRASAGAALHADCR